MPRPPHPTLLLGFLATVTLWSLVPPGLAAGQSDEREGRGYGGQQEPYAVQFGDLLSDLDTFWSDAFRDAGAVYRSPNVVPI